MHFRESVLPPAAPPRPPLPALPPWKRALDLTLCAAALPFLLLATAVMWIVTNVTAPGPVFFRQERVGYMGRRFVLYKFRTMHLGADASAHQAHVANLLRSHAPLRKLDVVGDKRLVPGGWIMRATGIDELPQLINVLRGEMSIVGPRPCIPYEYDHYAPQHRARFNAVPGLTGLWQVSGKNRTTFDEMVHLDVAYSERKSLALDLGIISRTPTALCRQVLDTRRQRRAHTGRAAAGAPAPSGTAATFQA